MTLKEFKRIALRTPFNTCNGWGFGGVAGYYYEYKNYVYTCGKRHFRHMPSEPYVKFFVPTRFKKKRYGHLTRKEFVNKIKHLEAV